MLLIPRTTKNRQHPDTQPMPPDSDRPSSQAVNARPFREGVIAMLPYMLPFGAYGFVTGMAMAQGLPLAAAVAMTVLVYAASSQLAALPLIAAQMPLWTIFFAATSVNLRFTIYSAAIQPWFSKLPFWRRIFLGYLNGDLAYVLFTRRYGGELPASGEQLAEHEAYFLGAGVCNYVGWQITALAGVFFGQYVPISWDIGFAGTLALLAIMIPLLTDRAGMLAALAAGGVCIWGLDWPYRLNIVAAVVVATVVGVIADRYLFLPQGSTTAGKTAPKRKEDKREGNRGR